MGDVVDFGERYIEREASNLAKKIVDEVLRQSKEVDDEMLICNMCNNEVFVVLRKGVACACCGFQISYDDF